MRNGLERNSLSSRIGSRTPTTWLLMLIACGAGGCQLAGPFQQTSSPPIPIAFQTTPTANELIETLNANTQEVRQLSSDVRVRITGAPPLSGTLIVDKPRNLRMKAGLIGMTEMGFDVGSNDSEFWLWTKMAVGDEPPTLYFARHDEYESSPLRQVLPLEPQWILDSIGLTHLSLDDVSAGPFLRPDGRYELRQTITGASGDFTKILVIDPKTGLLKQQAIYNPSQRLMAYANAIQHQYDVEHHTSLPRRIELYVLDGTGKTNSIVIDLANLKINQLYGDPNLQWARPHPNDARIVDLAKVSPAAQ